MSTEDGGPAFPVSDEESRLKVSGVYGGMSLRDWFAGHAMTGFVAMDANSAVTAAWSYELADAMLAERQKGKDSNGINTDPQAR